MRDLSFFYRDVFELGGVSSSRYGVILLEPPPIVAASREVERISVPGRSGDLLFDAGRYQNVEIPYRCAIVPEERGDLRKDAIAAANAFCPVARYAKLVDSFDPSHFRMARVCEQIDVESVVERAGKFSIRFDCMPQRWLVSGEIRGSYLSGDVIYDPTGQIAKPMITVYGTAAGNVTIGSATVEIRQITDQITLDCETQNAYRKVADGGYENKNGSIYAPEFPTLLPGENHIYFDGGITKVEIVPRWWEL